MISKSTFNQIIQNPESSTLDFKECFYDFKNDFELKNTAKFVKDIISFANTIRNEPAYIIFGVEQNGNEFNLKGIDYFLDDSILQEKIKNKVFPRVVFSSYEIIYNDIKFGIIEIPVFKYEFPVTPTVKLKSLEIGKIYYRSGSSNTEATSLEVIRINDWMRSLPELINSNVSANEEIMSLIKRIGKNEERVSSILADAILVAKKYNLENLKIFCQSQINGFNANEGDNHKYRHQKIFISPQSFEVNPYSLIDTDANGFKKLIEKEEGVIEMPFFFNQPILKIESWIDDFKNGNGNRYGSLKLTSKDVFKKGNYDLYLYIFQNNIEGLLINIKQKLVDELIKINL